jgi:hypothetical protein
MFKNKEYYKKNELIDTFEIIRDVVDKCFSLKFYLTFMFSCNMLLLSDKNEN